MGEAVGDTEISEVQILGEGPWSEDVVSESSENLLNPLTLGQLGEVGLAGRGG